MPGDPLWRPRPGQRRRSRASGASRGGGRRERRGTCRRSAPQGSGADARVHRGGAARGSRSRAKLTRTSQAAATAALAVVGEGGGITPQNARKSRLPEGNGKAGSLPALGWRSLSQQSPVHLNDHPPQPTCRLLVAAGCRACRRYLGAGAAPAATSSPSGQLAQAGSPAAAPIAPPPAPIAPAAGDATPAPLDPNAPAPIAPPPVINGQPATAGTPGAAPRPAVDTAAPAGAAANAGGARAREFQGDDVGQVLRLLARQAKINLIVSPQVVGTINMRLEDVTALQAIEVICQAQGYDLTPDQRRLLRQDPRREAPPSRRRATSTRSPTPAPRGASRCSPAS